MRYNCLSRKKPNAYKFNESKIKSKYFEQITSKGLFWLAKNDVIGGREFPVGGHGFVKAVLYAFLRKVITMKEGVSKIA